MIELLSHRVGECPTLEDDDCTNLYSYQQYMRWKILWLSVLQLILSLIFTNQKSVECYHIVLLICIFQIITDVERFFLCLLAFHGSLSVKCLFMSLAYFSVFPIDLQEYFIILFILILCVYCEIFLLVCNLSFHFLLGSLWEEQF